MSSVTVYGHEEIGTETDVTYPNDSTAREADDLDVKTEKEIKTQIDFQEFGFFPTDEFKAMKEPTQSDGDDDDMFNTASILSAMNFTNKIQKVYYWQVAQVDTSQLSLVQPNNNSFNEPRWVATLPPGKPTIPTLDWISIPLAVDIRITSYKKSCEFGGRSSKSVTGGISVLQTAVNGKGRFNLQMTGEGLVLTPSGDKNLNDGEFVVRLIGDYPDNTNFQVCLMQNGKEITNRYNLNCNKKVFRIIVQKKFICALATIQGKNIFLGNEKHDSYLGEVSVVTYISEHRSKKVELAVYPINEYTREGGN